MQHLNILVVDDSPITVKKITALLANLGHRVIMTAGTGQEALVAYGQCTPDLVTMDITMPDMDGIEATQKILAKFADARIIMVTSHGQEHMVMQAVKAGAKGYVLKPIDIERLKDAIARALAMSGAKN